MAQLPTNKMQEGSTALAPPARVAEHIRGSAFSPAAFGVHVKEELVLVSHCVGDLNILKYTHTPLFTYKDAHTCLFYPHFSEAITMFMKSVTLRIHV